MRRVVLAACVAALGMVFVASATAAPGIHSPKAHIAKKCKKKKKCKKHHSAPVTAPAPAPPAPLPLSESEVKSAVNQAAYNYCLPDIYCYDYGIYVDGAGNAACDSKTTYEWVCYGWNDEYDGSSYYTCDFRQVIDRSGYSSITSRQDMSYGSGGWVCS